MAPKKRGLQESSSDDENCPKGPGSGLCQERFIAPALVLLLHSLLVFDVAFHCRTLHEASTKSAIAWCLVAVGLISYLRTVISDPGFVQPGSVATDTLENEEDEGLLDVEETCSGEAMQSQTIGRAGADALSEKNGSRSIVSAEVSDVREASKLEPGSRVKKRQAGTKKGAELRFCKICKLQQPLRTKHCRDCGRCVRKHDHHCPWIGTCVGEGNHCFFFCFLLSTGLELMLFFGLGSSTMLGPDGSAGLALGLMFIGLLLTMVGCLMCFHFYLAVYNLTTWEVTSWAKVTYLRHINFNDGSPFSRNLIVNLRTFCCLPRCWRTRCRNIAGGVALGSDGWAAWEIRDPRHPVDCEVDCGRCGRWKWLCCDCYKVDSSE